MSAIRAGFPTSAQGTAQAQCAVIPVAAGDLMILDYFLDAPVDIASVSGGGVPAMGQPGGWTKINEYYADPGDWINGSGHVPKVEKWMGTVQTPGASTVVVTPSGSIATAAAEVCVSSFAGLGAGTVWIVVAQGKADSAGTPTTDNPLPVLATTAHKDGNEVYVCYSTFGNPTASASRTFVGVSGPAGFSCWSTALTARFTYRADLAPSTSYDPVLDYSTTNVRCAFSVGAVLACGLPPVVSTLGATGVGASGATLQGTVNPESEDASYYFEYGVSTSYGQLAPAASGASGASGATGATGSTGATGAPGGAAADLIVPAGFKAVTSMLTVLGDYDFTKGSMPAGWQFNNGYDPAGTNLVTPPTYWEDTPGVTTRFTSEGVGLGIAKRAAGGYRAGWLESTAIAPAPGQRWRALIRMPKYAGMSTAPGLWMTCWGRGRRNVADGGNYLEMDVWEMMSYQYDHVYNTLHFWPANTPSFNVLPWPWRFSGVDPTTGFHWYEWQWELTPPAGATGPMSTVAFDGTVKGQQDNLGSQYASNPAGSTMKFVINNGASTGSWEGPAMSATYEPYLPVWLDIARIQVLAPASGGGSSAPSPALPAGYLAGKGLTLGSYIDDYFDVTNGDYWDTGDNVNMVHGTANGVCNSVKSNAFLVPAGHGDYSGAACIRTVSGHSVWATTNPQGSWYGGARKGVILPTKCVLECWVAFTAGSNFDQRGGPDATHAYPWNGPYWQQREGLSYSELDMLETARWSGGDGAAYLTYHVGSPDVKNPNTVAPTPFLSICDGNWHKITYVQGGNSGARSYCLWDGVEVPAGGFLMRDSNPHVLMLTGGYTNIVPLVFPCDMLVKHWYLWNLS